MLDDILDLVLMDGIPDVVKVALVTLSAFWPLVREVDLHLRHCHDLVK